MDEATQKRFHTDMLAIYDKCAAIKYRPIIFRRMVLKHKGYEAAKRLIRQPETSGLSRLIAEGKPEWSMEHLMLQPEYASGFSDIELREAAKRLGRKWP